MEQPAAFAIQVLRPNGVVERMVVASSRMVVGTGAHCDIRIEGTGAAREHVELEIEGEHVVARAKCHSPPPLLNGSPLVAGKLEPEAQIAVCGTRITVNVVRELSPKRARGAGRRMLSTFGIAFAMVALPGVVYAALRPRDDDSIGPPPPAVALWDEQPPACKFDTPDQAQHLAAQMRAAAEAKRERYPFALEDGVAAVAAFEVAAACDKVAGRMDESAREAVAARALRAVVDRDYVAHQARLFHAIDTEDGRHASMEVHVLRSLTRGRKGAYVDWLELAERQLEMAQREAEKK